jgi:hypothetical protein
MVPKDWLFERGGRPVIYQTDDEYSDLPESLRWRHVQYDPPNGVDFTWEREWRIKIDELPLDSSVTGVLVPDAEWEGQLRRDYKRDQDLEVLQYSLIFDEEIAEMYREKFPWTF